MNTAIIHSYSTQWWWHVDFFGVLVLQTWKTTPFHEPISKHVCHNASLIYWTYVGNCIWEIYTMGSFSIACISIGFYFWFTIIYVGFRVYSWYYSGSDLVFSWPQWWIIKIGREWFISTIHLFTLFRFDSFSFLFFLPHIVKMINYKHDSSLWQTHHLKLF